MYLPASSREDDRDGQHALIEAHPLGTLVALGPAGFDASPLTKTDPLVLRNGARG